MQMTEVNNTNSLDSSKGIRELYIQNITNSTLLYYTCPSGYKYFTIIGY